MGGVKDWLSGNQTTFPFFANLTTWHSEIFTCACPVAWAVRLELTPMLMRQLKFLALVGLTRDQFKSPSIRWQVSHRLPNGIGFVLVTQQEVPLLNLSRPNRCPLPTSSSPGSAAPPTPTSSCCEFRKVYPESLLHNVGRLM